MNDTTVGGKRSDLCEIAVFGMLCPTAKHYAVIEDVAFWMPDVKLSDFDCVITPATKHHIANLDVYITIESTCGAVDCVTNNVFHNHFVAVDVVGCVQTQF